MRRIQCAVPAILFVVGSASAALAAPPVPYSWTGFYAGGNVGYSFGNANSTYNEPEFGVFGHGTISDSAKLDGVIGGGQIGYNWQTSNNMSVVGIEADFQGSGERGNSSVTAPYLIVTSFAAIDPAVTMTNGTNLQWFGTVRARIGALITPTTLLYATGGLAYGSISASGAVANDALGPWSFGTTTIKGGWTMGAGIEGAVPNTTNWTWKLEYLYIDFGTVGGNGFSADGFPYSFATTVTDNIVRVGFNYNFH
jgi:outer membrane immunogenic protein